MTTVAFDGRTMAADTLATDAWGLKEEVRDKILRGPDFLAGSAGQNGAIKAWWAQVAGMSLAEVLAYGYPEFAAERNDPAIMLVDAAGHIWRHVTGGFFQCSRGIHAVGSGRDYALGAMASGKTAEEAVRLVMRFDNGTGGDVVVEELQVPPAISDAARLDFISAGASVAQYIENGYESWVCRHSHGVSEGSSLREALDNAIRGQPSA